MFFPHYIPSKRRLFFICWLANFVVFCIMQNIFKIVGNVLRTRENLSKSLRPFCERAKASQNRWEHFANTRKPLKTVENILRTRESFSKSLRTFCEHAKASQNRWEHFAWTRNAINQSKTLFCSCASFWRSRLSWKRVRLLPPHRLWATLLCCSWQVRHLCPSAWHRLRCWQALVFCL